MPNWLGDVVFSLPALQAIRNQFPQSRITLITRRPADDFLKHHPAVDSVIRITASKQDGWLASLRFALTLRKFHFDLSILFPNSLRAALMSFLSGSRFRTGYKTDSRGWLLTHPIPTKADSRTIHGVDYYLGVAQGLGAVTDKREFDPVLKPEDLDAQKQFLEEKGVGDGDLLIALGPGASKPEKRWHAERFAELCTRLIREHNARVLVLGSPDERALVDSICGSHPADRAIPLVGMNIHHVLGMLKHCRLMVANDSGLMNLSAMVGTPVVALFGPGNVKTTDPCIEPEKKEIVSKNYPCSPCRHRFFEECEPSPNNKPFCIEDITVNDVMEAVERLKQRVG